VSAKSPSMNVPSTGNSSGANQRVPKRGLPRSPSQTQAPPPEKCADKAGYTYDNDAIKTCKWIRANSSRQQKLCKDAEVAVNCPISCGHCCEDDNSYRFEISAGVTQDCSWLTRTTKASARATKWCEKYRNGVMIWDACPKACGLCEENANNILRSLDEPPSRRSSGSSRRVVSPSMSSITQESQPDECVNKYYTDFFTFNNDAPNITRWLATY